MTTVFPSRFPALLCSSAILIWACTIGQAVELHFLDGHQQTVNNWVIDGQHLTVDENQRHDLSDLDRIILGPPATRLDQQADQGLLLKDGSWVPYIDLQAAQDAVSVTSPLGPLTIPLGSVVAWGLESWVTKQRSATKDVVRLESGDLSGRVTGIRDGHLLFASDLAEDTLRLPIATVQALHLALPVDRPRGVHLSTRLDPRFPPVLLIGNDGQLALQAHPMQSVAIDSIRELVVHGGRRVYLSELSPSRVKEEGAFGVVWPHARNSNIDGSPLFVDGVHVAFGLVIHSKATLEWELNGAYTRFSSAIAISDAMGHEGDCEVRILGDGKVLWQHPRIRGGEPAHQVDLNLSNVNTLTVIVDYGERYDIGDHLALAGAWLLRKP